jgi:5,10-methenyltetrahydrofolate synthetase
MLPAASPEDAMRDDPPDTLPGTPPDNPPDPRRWAAWRKTERRRLIAARLAMPASVRRHHALRIGAALDGLLGDVAGLLVAVYWPIRGEPDLRAWIDSLRARGARCALPVVVARDAPLAFREWPRGARLRPGAWNIPEPADGAPVVPQVVLAPVVGFDRDAYRLGHGGGYYDRTLAIASPRPRAIGVGYADAEIPSILPQPHDVAMDLVVTELGVAAASSHRPTVHPTFRMGSQNP